MKIFFSICLIFIVMYLPFGVFAQQHIPSNLINYELDSLTSFKSAKGYVPSLFRNLGEQAGTPFHFTAKEWIVAGATIGVTGLLVG